MILKIDSRAPVSIPAPAVNWIDDAPYVDVWTRGTDEMRRWTIRVNRLLAPGDKNAKLAKNGKTEVWDTRGLSLAPAKTSGIGNTCAFASVGCAGACLDHQGMGGVWDSIPAGRIARTALWYLARDWFLDKLARELAAAQRSAERRGRRLAVRLNVFSDIPWEQFVDFGAYSGVEFYDYTKNPRRAGAIAPNYWVTFSRSESNEEHCRAALARGANVAIPFAVGRQGRQVSGQASPDDLPREYMGAPVVDGDITDLRFDDARRPRGYIVGLRLKAGSWREYYGAIDSGFAVPSSAPQTAMARLRCDMLRGARIGV